MAVAADEEEVVRWKVRVEENAGLMSLGVMEVPFAPLEGLARKLATRAWFVNSAGELIRTGSRRTCVYTNLTQRPT